MRLREFAFHNRTEAAEDAILSGFEDTALLEVRSTVLPAGIPAAGGLRFISTTVQFQTSAASKLPVCRRPGKVGDASHAYGPAATRRTTNRFARSSIFGKAKPPMRVSRGNHLIWARSHATAPEQEPIE